MMSIIILRSQQIKRINQLCKKYNESLLPPLRSPDNIVIAFDLHGVLFRHDYKKMIHFFIKSDDKWKLIKTTLNPALWIDVFKIARTSSVPEAFIMRLAQQHNTIKSLLPSIIHIMNAQVPHQPTVELAYTLKKEGYILHIISNIGETIYRDLEQQFPEILSMFDHVVVTCAANGYISKPNPEMYYQYLSTINHKQKPIFIDDKIKNIRSALNCSIASIYYSSLEHTIQSLKDLLGMF